MKARTLRYRGKQQHLSAWARSLRLSRQTLNARLARGWTLKRALSRPKRRYLKLDDLKYGGFR